MLEPIQNCFTFYHPDGKSSAHKYLNSDKLIRNNDLELKATLMVAQQDLALSTSSSIKSNS